MKRPKPEKPKLVQLFSKSEEAIYGGRMNAIATLRHFAIPSSVPTAYITCARVLLSNIDDIVQGMERAPGSGRLDRLSRFSMRYEGNARAKVNIGDPDEIKQELQSEVRVQTAWFLSQMAATDILETGFAELVRQEKLDAAPVIALLKSYAFEAARLTVRPLPNLPVGSVYPDPQIVAQIASQNIAEKLMHK